MITRSQRVVLVIIAFIPEISLIPSINTAVFNLKFLSLAKNPDLKALPDSLADLEQLEVINLKDSLNVKIGPRLQEKDDNEDLIIIR